MGGEYDPHGSDKRGLRNGRLAVEEILLTVQEIYLTEILQKNVHWTHLALDGNQRWLMRTQQFICRFHKRLSITWPAERLVSCTENSCVVELISGQGKNEHRFSPTLLRRSCLPLLSVLPLTRQLSLLFWCLFCTDTLPLRSGVLYWCRRRGGIDSRQDWGGRNVSWKYTIVFILSWAVLLTL